jgi:hypothetical protein
MMIKKISAVLVLVSALSACGPAPYWTLADDTSKSARSKSFEMIVPEGWNRTTVAEKFERHSIGGGAWFRNIPLERMTTSRDGWAIQAITATRRNLETAFPNIDKKATATMLPGEAADLYVADLRKSSGLERLKVLNNIPATVNNKPGFQLVMEYKNDDGLRIRIATHGFVDKTGFYTISYRAPVLYYYARDYADYAKLVRTFRQLNGA